jgi:hypothetical protein
LHSSYSSPPIVSEGSTLPRHNTYSEPSKSIPIPVMERSTTMPQFATSPTGSSKREKRSDAKPKTALGDSGYSSSSQPEDIYASKKGRHSKERIYSYQVPVEVPSSGYRTEIRSPKDAPSPVERPSPSARRPSYVSEQAIPRPPMPQSTSSSRILPDRTRARGRDRDREEDYRGTPSREKLYGESGPGYPSGNSRAYREEHVSRGKKFTYDDVQYTPGLHRNNTMPVGAS